VLLMHSFRLQQQPLSSKDESDLVAGSANMTIPCVHARWHSTVLLSNISVISVSYIKIDFFFIL